jgi:hypothetical protein
MSYRDAGVTLALLVATGCAGAQPVPGVSTRAAVPWAAAEPTRYVHSDSITIWLFAPAEARAGEPVPMRVELENTSDRGWINVRLRGRAPHADFVVTTASGDEIWSVYADLDRLANADYRRLDTRERVVFPFEWAQETRGMARPGPRVAPGDYFLRARIWLGDRTAETPRRPLRITR